jgi:hypothetical protein
VVLESQVSRRWLVWALVGAVMVLAALATLALVYFDKPHFGFLVGRYFLEVVSAVIVAGSLMMLVGTWKAAPRRDWAKTVLLLWAVIALVSPATGLFFLFPAFVLVLSLPVMLFAMHRLWSASR